MADTAAADTKDTKTVATPEKKVLLEDEADKKIVDDVVDDDSKASENGDKSADVTNETTKTATSLKENGSTEEKETVPAADNKEPESTGNGVSTDAAPAVAADACCIKRKSTVSVGADAVDGTTPATGEAEGGASPEKKAKLEEKSPAVAEAENNGGVGGEAEAAA